VRYFRQSLREAHAKESLTGSRCQIQRELRETSPDSIHPALILLIYNAEKENSPRKSPFGSAKRYQACGQMGLSGLQPGTRAPRASGADGGAVAAKGMRI
jgi:hypothetical protein